MQCTQPDLHTPCFCCSYLKLRKVDDEEAERQKQLQSIQVGDSQPKSATWAEDTSPKTPENKFMGEMDLLNAFLEATFISKLLAGLSRSRSSDDSESSESEP